MTTTPSADVKALSDEDIEAAFWRVSKIFDSGCDRCDGDDLALLEKAGLMKCSICSDAFGQDTLEVGEPMWAFTKQAEMLRRIIEKHEAATITTLETRLAQSSAEVAVMREALRKFGRTSNMFWAENDKREVWSAHAVEGWVSITVADLRAADKISTNPSAAAQELLADLKDAETNAEHYIHLAFVDAGANGPVAWKDRAQELLAERDRLKGERDYLQSHLDSKEAELALLKRTYNDLFDATAKEQARAEAAEQQIAQLRATQRTPGSFESCNRCQLKIGGDAWISACPNTPCPISPASAGSG